MYGYCMFINCTYRTKKSRWWKLLVSDYKLRNSTKSWHKSLICTTAGCSSVPLVLKTETKKRHKQQGSCEGPSRVLQVNLTEATVKTECDWMCERNDPSTPYVTHLHLQWTCCPDSSQCFSATGRIHHSALVCPDARWESNTLSCCMINLSVHTAHSQHSHYHLLILRHQLALSIIWGAWTTELLTAAATPPWRGACGWSCDCCGLKASSCCLQGLTCCPATTAWGVPSSQTRTSARPPSSSPLTSIRPHWVVSLWAASPPPWPATPPSSTATTQRPLVITAAPPPSPALEVPSCLHRPSPPCCLLSVESPHTCFW